jgi:adhesin transport system outer membrane protein
MLKKILLVSIIAGSQLDATSLRDTIEQTLNINPDIVSEHYNKKSNKLKIKEKSSGYYPTINFTMYGEGEESHTKQNDRSKWKKDYKKKLNGNLKLEQTLYSGGKFSGEIQKEIHNYNSEKFKSDQTVEDIILDVTNIYLDLVLNQSLKAFGDHKILAHQYYLKLAQDKEDVSGEILDRLNVESKIKSLIDSNLEQSVKNQKAISSFTKLSGFEKIGNICKPIINEDLIPSTLDEAIDIALTNNNKIKSQYEVIQEQQAVIQVQKAKFKPDLKLSLEANTELTNEEWTEKDKTEINKIKAKLSSTWNFYKGGKDQAVLEKEKITMLKEIKKLDAIKSSN